MSQISFITSSAKSGMLTLSVVSEDGREVFLHSRIHPEKDCSVSLPGNFPGTVILLGFGLGYHVMNLNAEKIKEIIAFDISEEITKTGQKIFQESNSGSVKLRLFFPDENDLSDKFWEEIIAVDVSSSFIVLEHPASARAFPSYYSKIKESFNSFIAKKTSDKLTIKRFGVLYFKNIIKNMKSFVSSPSIACFKEKFKEYEAVIASSGPSIDLYVEKLKTIENKVFIIALDSAVPVLSANGIDPDFVVSIDPQAYTWEHLSAIKPSTVLIQSLTAHNAVKTDHHYFYLNSHPMCQIIDHLFDVENIDSNCGNVAGDALKFAEYCGFKKISILGIDSSFPFHEIYSKSSSYQKRYLSRSTRFNTLEKQNSDYIFKNSSNYKFDGKNTRKSFVNYKIAIEKMLNEKYVHVSRYSLPLKNTLLSNDLVCNSLEIDKSGLILNQIRSGNFLDVPGKKLNDFIMQTEVKEELLRQSFTDCSEKKRNKLLELLRCALV